MQGSARSQGVFGSGAGGDEGPDGFCHTLYSNQSHHCFWIHAPELVL